MTKTSIVACCSLLLLLSCSEDDPAQPSPEPPGLTDPVFEYGRGEGNSITGGYVYRGATLTDLVGKYVYADFGSGRIWALSYDGSGPGTSELLIDTDLGISTFGVDGAGRLLVANYGPGGALFELTGSFDPGSGSWVYALGPSVPANFSLVTDVRSPGNKQLYVVEQAGRILLADTSAATAPTIFLDLTGKVTSGGELGLLGLALHPDFENNGRFFVYYTTGSGPWTSHLSRFTTNVDPSTADPASEVELLSIPQEFANHNGGGLAFDGNGYLLLSVGDEGRGGDPNQNAQDVSDLHGKVLRLDVDVDEAPYYGIPADNPFASGEGGARPEIFAYGLRNPWRMSYDATTGRIWVGDVGQGMWEEIDIIVSGANYGWDCREGMHPYVGPPDGPSPVCAEFEMDETP